MRKVPIDLRGRKGVDYAAGRGALGLVLTLPLVADEEEGFVFCEPHSRNAYWPSEGGTKLMTLESIAWQRQTRERVWMLIEEAIGIEGVVAREVECRPVIVIGPRLGHNADDAAAVAPVLRRVVTLQDAELRDGVGIRVEHHAVVQQIIVEASIQKECHRVGTATADAEAAGRAVLVVLVGDARFQARQVENVAAIQWHVHEFTTGHRSS